MNQRKVSDEVDKLLENSEHRYLSLSDVSTIYEQVFPRRQYFPKPENYNEKDFARDMVSCLPTESIDDIVRGVQRQDPRLILLYGDCFMYGLKNCRQNPKKAYELYKQAAELNQPEAMVTLARLCDESVDVYAYRGLHEIICSVFHAPSLNTCIAMSLKLEEMWHWLQKSAELGWFSFMFVTEALHEMKTSKHKLKPVIKNALIQLNLLE
jgi:hypothetical protein